MSVKKRVFQNTPLPQSGRHAMFKNVIIQLLVVMVVLTAGSAAASMSVKSTPQVPSIQEYLTEFKFQRTCWWNEICKEEFQSRFRCKCPVWSYCTAPGQYYNAYCSIASTGYIWPQPLLK